MKESENIFDVKFVIAGINSTKFKDLLIEEMRKNNVMPFLYIADEEVIEDIKDKVGDGNLKRVMLAIDYNNNPIMC